MPSPRIIPALEQLRQHREFQDLEVRYGRDLLVRALREESEALRRALSGGNPEADLPESVEAATGALRLAVEARLARMLIPSLQPAINATGVIVHTNLGRAPLADAALQRVAQVAAGYSNLEYDVEAGGRGRRDVHAERLLTLLTGAEAAVVVNNNAAATLLALAALARGREVIISRGELVEIGGGFRVPDIMAQSGAILREVGTTNRTREADYAAAISDRTGLILRVHPSNFRIEGFTDRPSAAGLVALGRRFGVPVVEDLGSGNLMDPLPGSATGSVRAEPTVQASVKAGFDVVWFSGDKLLGGPQAGVLAGRRTPLETIRRHPLVRAFRVDKLTYAALEATLLEYAKGRAHETVPVVAMLALSRDEVARRATALAGKLRNLATVRTSLHDGVSTVGGGSAPGMEIPTCLLAIESEGTSAASLEQRLRALPTPVIARIERDRVVLDLRTVLPWQDDDLAALLALLRL